MKSTAYKRRRKRWSAKEGGMERNILDSLDVTSWEETVSLDVNHFPSVNLILRSPAFAQNQISSGAFFSCEIGAQVYLTPCDYTAVSVVKCTW